jgi:hypothetical protein
MVEAVAAAFSMAWPQEVVQDGQGGEQAHGVLAAFRGELFRCLGKYRTRCARCATRCCASRTGYTWPRSCRWSRSAAAGTVRCTRRSTAGRCRSRGWAGSSQRPCRSSPSSSELVTSRHRSPATATATDLAIRAVTTRKPVTDRQERALVTNGTEQARDSTSSSAGSAYFWNLSPGGWQARVTCRAGEGEQEIRIH